jgi:hypothetical protein
MALVIIQKWDLQNFSFNLQLGLKAGILNFLLGQGSAWSTGR